MDDKFLKLTNTVYKILEFFPESDPLKYRAKDKALAIMEGLVLINETSGWTSFQKEKVKVQLFEDIDILVGYLWIGKSQGWLNSVNCLIISNEYENIKKSVSPAMELTKVLPGMEHDKMVGRGTQIERIPVLNNTESKIPNLPMSHRQEQIIGFLNKNAKAQVMDLQKVLPDITKRTIRRDLDDLLESGKIIRSGDFNQVFYKLNG